METELQYDTGIKSEELEILDVKLEQEDNNFEDESLNDFAGSDLEVISHIDKQLSTFNHKDNCINSEKIVLERKEVNSNAKENDLNKITENYSEAKPECTLTAQDRSFTSPINSTRAVHCKKTENTQLKGLLNSIENTSCSEVDILQQSPCQKIPSTIVDSIIMKKDIMVRGKKTEDCEDSNLTAQDSHRKPHVCPYCDFQTSFYNLLSNHLRRHNIRQPWACSKCSRSFTNKAILERHVRLVHEKPKVIFCNECSFRCSRQRELKNHMLVHTGINYFQCSECDYKHKSQGGVKRHMILHLDNSLGLKCTICSYKGVKPEYLTRHMEKHHKFELDFEESLETDTENVDINSLSFTNRLSSDIRKIVEKQPVVLLKRCDDEDELNNSVVNMEEIHEQVLQDNFLEVAQCGEPEDNHDSLDSEQQEDVSSLVLKSTLITKNKNIITSIVKVVESDTIDPAELQLKPKPGASTHQTQPKAVVINEIVYNKGSRNSKTSDIYRCKECSFVSTWFDRFKTHLKCHKRKHLSCDMCDFLTNSQAYLARHKRLTHIKKRDFKCTKCDYHTSISHNLKAHMSSHMKTKRFACEKCRIKCKTADALRRHMITHEEEKPFECELCDFRTRYKISLRNHMFVHTGETKFVCKICNYKFYSNCLLKKHIVEIHGPSQ